MAGARAGAWEVTGQSHVVEESGDEHGATNESREHNEESGPGAHCGPLEPVVARGACSQ